MPDGTPLQLRVGGDQIEGVGVRHERRIARKHRRDGGVAVGIGSEAAADDDRVQIVEFGQRSEHQLGTGRIDSKIGRPDRIDIDASRAQAQCSAAGQQRCADHAATATDDGEIAVGALVRVTATWQPHGAEVIDSDQVTTGSWCVNSDRFDDDVARRIDAVCGVQPGLVADERHRRSGADTGDAADPGAGVRIESARHIDRIDDCLAIHPFDRREKLARQRTGHADAEQRVDDDIESFIEWHVALDTPAARRPARVGSERIAGGGLRGAEQYTQHVVAACP